MAHSDSRVVVSKKRANQSVQNQTPLPVFIALAGLLGGLLWWKRSKPWLGKGKGHRSGFKFPAKGKDAATTGGVSSSSNLPRNKAANNKKNKQRKKDEREKRAEKRDKQLDNSKPAEREKIAGDEGDNTLVLNYSFYDSARRDTLAPASKMRSLGDGTDDK